MLAVYFRTYAYVYGDVLVACVAAVAFRIADTTCHIQEVGYDAEGYGMYDSSMIQRARAGRGTKRVS